MKWTGLNELREKYLSFFESKEHLRYPSAPLVPQEDNSLLLINSGMAPLKKYFLGLETPPRKRMTTCQKCIRTPDIEQVGKTSRHGTYFEMLGNFSFGDYFKEEATTWAWEFLTEVLEIPKELLWVTIYQDDDEAFEIWTKRRGVSPDRVVRLGKEDNFWEIGSGPCGPCSEIYVDRGEAYGCDAPECGIGKCDCDRYMEIWNLVFTQFDSDGQGNYERLEHPNIDTGMGLERLACAMQGVDNLFEVDTVQNIMKHISKIAGATYHNNPQNDISLRVVTDHIRSTTFMVGDGVIPSNEGRGYVLRRLLRRAARHGRLLGIEGTFLYQVCDTVIEENKGQYPELLENADYIKKIIRVEEERFTKTIEQGMEMLSGILDKLDTATISKPMIEGSDLFRLYDTFGFPIDLTREIAESRGIAVDEDGFLAHMKEQRERARKAHEEQGGIGWEADVLADQQIEDRFVGYDTLGTETAILAMVCENQLTEQLVENQQAMLVLKETPFYAESGGQVGDKGIIFVGENLFQVEDTRKSPTGHFLHIGKLVKGTLKLGGTVTAQVDAERRGRIMRNHSATHLLQSALREVLGDHVHQAGSYVDESISRFDFTHFSAVTPEQLAQVEAAVNRNIMQSIPVNTDQMPIEEAKKIGAMALFGDKYSDIVRVCHMGDASTELCGGTHVANTAQIGLYKILSESSVAAGVRRIESTAGMGILDVIGRQRNLMLHVGSALKVNSATELVARAAALAEHAGQLEKQVKDLENQITELKTKDIALEQIGPVKFVAAAFDASLDASQERADNFRDQNPDVVGVFIAMGEENASVLVFAGKDAVAAGINAGKLVKEITAVAGGSGGGRPDNAKGGISDIHKVDDALASAKGFVKAQLGL